jgi:hypothetical protein
LGETIRVFVGIPTAILLLALGVLGIRTYKDFSDQVDKAQKEVAASLLDAKTQAGKLKSDGDVLAGEYAKLKTQLAVRITF